MKILHVITGLGHGGAEGSLFRLIQFSRHIDHRVISLTNGGYYGEKLLSDGVNVDVLNMQGFLSIPASLSQLAEKIRRADPDLIQTWMYHADFIGGLAAKFAGYRNVHWGLRHSTLRTSETKLSTRLVARCCAKLSYFIPSKIIACSKSGADWHEQFGYDAQIMEVVPNGYDLNRFSPPKYTQQIGVLRKKFNIEKQSFVAGMMARWHPDKDHETLFKSLAFFKEKNKYCFKLLLAGPGINKSNKVLNRLIKKYSLGEDVYLCGVQEKPAQFMHEIDLHILTSRTEAFPNVVAEAMACEVPCIVTDVGDAKNIVSNTGWIVEPTNHIAVAEAVSSAILEKESSAETTKPWQTRKKLARLRIRNEFSIEKMVGSFEKFWSQTIQDSKKNVQPND